MRLFGYYAIHTVKNQIRKLLKTWVLVFLVVCMGIGVISGLTASKISDMAEQHGEQEMTEEEDILSIAGEDAVVEEHGAPNEEAMRLFEAVAALVLLALFLYEIFSADKSAAKIFLPADVNVLFASPMKPQSVLMFRLMTQIGVMIFMAFYFMLQIPNLMNAGLTLFSAIACICVFFAAVIVCTVFQLLIYIHASNHPSFAKYLRYGLFALVGLIAVSFAAYMRLNALTPYEAFLGYFSAPASRLIPFWGWLKGILAGAFHGNATQVLVFAALSVIGTVILVYLVWQMPADFYEDAMFKSEERAEIMRMAKESRTGIAFKKRKKDRSESLKRDGMHFGHGANVFFFKTLYNRFRFAHLRFFTKTMETYLILAVAVSLLARFGFIWNNLLPAVIAVSLFAFYRALGNPLEEDMKSDYFRLVPESTFSKLFYSLLGGTVCCMLDTLPALVASALLTNTNPLQAIWWTLFVVAVDFYATCTGAFIYLSLPANAGATVKQAVQMLFLYFGLLPSIALMAVGMVTERLLVFALITAAVNLFLGLLFLALATICLDPGEGRIMLQQDETRENMELPEQTVKTEQAAETVLAAETVQNAEAVAVQPQPEETPVSSPADETVQETQPEADIAPERPKAPAEESASVEKAERVRNGRRTFSRIGLGLALMGAITYGFTIVVASVLSVAKPELMQNNVWLAYAIQYGFMYFIGFPVFLILVLRLPHVKTKEKQSLGVGKFVAAVCICFLAVVIGSIVSAVINNMMSDAFGLDISNLVQQSLLRMEWYTRVIVAVIIAPLMEELIFRKILIDRMRLYGERLAVITSGLLFGLFHGNLSQLVYAALLGFIFGYIYLRTGKLRYTIALHFIINGLTTLSSILLSSMDPDAMQTMLESDLTDTEKMMSILSPAVIGISFITVMQYALAVAGIVMFIICVRKVRFQKADWQLPFGKRFVTVWCNPGMLIFLVVILAEFAISYMNAG